MTTHADFEDFFRLLNEHGVEYMIVGGYAVAYHGYPRFTKDIDVFYGNTRANTQRLQAALVTFGFQASSIPLEVIEKPNAVLSIGLLSFLFLIPAIWFLYRMIKGLLRLIDGRAVP